MPVGERPILEIVLRQLRKGGCTEATLAVGHLGSLIQTYFGDGSRFGIALNYVFESHPLGTAGPLKNIGGLDHAFLVVNGDTLTDLDFADIATSHERSGSRITIGCYQRAVTIDFGVLETSADELIGYAEKPTLSYLCSMGVYVLEPDVLRYIAAGERVDFPDLVSRLLAAGQRVSVYRHRGIWLDIGRHEDLLEAQRVVISDHALFGE
jgi:NDP-sugar pyrophosphorylase family protein